MGTSATLQTLKDHHKQRQEHHQTPPGWPVFHAPRQVAGSGPQKLLEAARSFQERTFTVEDLCVAAWKLYPDVFGLPGYKELHPNNNQIVAMLSGNRGLVRRGYLRRRAGGLLQVEVEEQP